MGTKILVVAFGAVASHGGHPLQGIVALVLFGVFGAVGDLGFLRSVFRPLLRAGRPRTR